MHLVVNTNLVAVVPSDARAPPPTTKLNFMITAVNNRGCGWKGVEPEPQKCSPT